MELKLELKCKLRCMKEVNYDHREFVTKDYDMIIYAYAVRRLYRNQPSFFHVSQAYSLSDKLNGAAP